MEEERTTTVPEAYLKNIEKKLEDLRILVEVSTLLSSTLELDELMPLVMEKAKNVMDAEACSILFYNRETNKLEFEIAMCGEDSASDILKKTVTLDMGQGIAGWVAENLQPLIINDVNKDNRFFQDADKITGFVTRSIIAVPLTGRSGLIGVAEIINPGRKDYDPEIFQLLCKQFAIAIENARFHKESIQRERIKQELEIASVLQKSFLPESPVFHRGNATVSALTIAAENVGGDIYDFIEPVKGKIGVLVGDVSGKGISAALYMAKIISDFRFTAHHIESPDIVLNRLNAHLSKTPRGMFLTAAYMIVDTIAGTLDVSVAGHPPFLWLTKGEVKVMEVQSGPPLGIMPLEYPTVSFTLSRGDRLVMLTDGVFDAKNKTGERLGFDTLINFIKNHYDDKQLVQGIVGAIDIFSKGTGRADDLTLVELLWA
jgi:sigma-B regulation protein RsbU (phosphoserine phosphatase)